MANFNQYRTTPYANKALNDRMTSLRNGRTQAQYGQDIKDANPPYSPKQWEIHNLYQNGTGDRDYELDQINQTYAGAEGQASMQKFWAENPSWYQPNGTPIPHQVKGMSDEFNASAAQRRQAEALRSPTPQVQAPIPQPSQVQAPIPQPSQVQQNMNQTIVKKPVQNYNAVQPANSGWQAGGWK